MKSFVSLFVAAAGLLDLANATYTTYDAEIDARAVTGLRTMTYKGCYSSNGGATLNNDTYIFNTEGWCQEQCVPLKKGVLLTSAGIECWCGTLLPNSLYKVDNSSCNVPCMGDSSRKCGGYDGFYSVYNDGYLLVDPKEASASSSSASATATPTSATGSGATKEAATVVVTSTPQTTSSSASSPSKKSGPNVAAIAAGVVVGFVIIAALAAGAFLWYRNKKRHEIEEEHRRSAANSSAAGKPPLSAGSSWTDTRLDPVVMARRQSDGSIADNQDYSRRILKVTNA